MNNTTNKHIGIGPVAESVPFDNTNDPDCDLTSEDVQSVIEELCHRIEDSASPGFTWGDSGNVNNSYLLNDTVPSNKSGRLCSVTGNIVTMFLSIENATAVTIQIQRRVGVVFTTIASITTLATERTKIITVAVPVTFGDELCAYVNGSCKSPVIGIVMKG